jgi:hypothetical protein
MRCRRLQPPVSSVCYHATALSGQLCGVLYVVSVVAEQRAPQTGERKAWIARREEREV